MRRETLSLARNVLFLPERGDKTVKEFLEEPEPREFFCALLLNCSYRPLYLSLTKLTMKREVIFDHHAEDPCYSNSDFYDFLVFELFAKKFFRRKKIETIL